MRRPTDSTSAWKSAVEGVIQDLQRLNQSTEHDFLAVGERLMEFRSMARRIASDMTALNELISGEHGRRASDVLSRVLHHSKATDAKIAQSGEALGEVRDLARRVRLDFDGLRHRVLIFQTLCTLTRIETSRLGKAGADFGDLSAEVKPLSEIIQKSGEGVLASASRLDQGVQSALRSGADLRVRQLRDMPALIDGVVASLGALEERRARAAELSAGQALQYAAICQAIEDLVRSVQFHDITRQQIEHVVEALQQVHAENQESVAAVLTLQASQLSGAARLFTSSVENMERDLDSIAARVKEMAEASQDLMGVSAGEHSSFFIQMEGQFSVILEMLRASSSAQTGMEATTAQLEQTIEEMSASVEQIRGVEIRIQRIATNATIQAAHIGDSGDALSVIAEVMQNMSFESNRNTEDVAGALNAMSTAAGRVAGGDHSDQSNEEAITSEMRSAVVDLHASSESAFQRVTEISALGARLAEDIAAVRAGFSVGELFNTTVASARSQLERVGAHGDGGPALVPTHLLESHAKRYTMKIERDVHESVAQGVVVGAVAASADANQVAIKEDALGDNVEFF